MKPPHEQSLRPAAILYSPATWGKLPSPERGGQTKNLSVHPSTETGQLHMYREEGLTLKRKKPKRRRSAVRRERGAAPTVVNERWAMDFVHDTLSNGRTVRVLTVLDVYSRECVALQAGVGFRCEDVAGILSAVAKKRGSQPKVISVDNDTEFTSKALDHWAYWNQVKLDFSRPGKPTDNPFIEAFNGSLRRECLSQHWFIDLKEDPRSLEGRVQQREAPQ